jgi:hypothetical protein
MATILDLFRNSNKDINYKSPDKTPMSEGVGEDDSKNIDKKGIYYTGDYKYGINYSTDVDKQNTDDGAFQLQLGNRQVDIGGVRNGALKIAKILPKKTFTRVKNVVDQELSGLRIKHLGSVIDIYGTDLIRITKQRTDLVERMKKSTTEDKQIKNLINNLRNFKENVKQKVGNLIGIPRDTIPTTVIEIGKDENIFREYPGNEQDTMENLAKIQKKAAGSIIGRFLAKNTGTPKQIVKSAVGGVGKNIKKKVRGALFGRGTTIGVNEPQRNESQNVIYGSGGSTGDQRYTLVMEEETRTDATESPITDRPSDGDGTLLNWLDDIKYPINAKRKNDRKKGYLETSTKITAEFDRPGAEYRKFPGIDRGYRLKFNKQLFQIGNEESTRNLYIDNVIIQIGSVRFHNAAISGLSETFSPSWSSYRMVGSPFNAYTYDSIDRSVSFNIKLYALNPKQHKENWDNIQKINNLVYPLSYVGSAGAVTPPITNITLGDMYINKSGFIESLSYNVDDEGAWELGRADEEVYEYKRLFENEHLKDGEYIQLGSQLSDVPNRWDKVNELLQVKNYKAPRLIEMQITFKFIEYRSSGEYSFKVNENVNPVRLESLSERDAEIAAARRFPDLNTTFGSRIPNPNVPSVPTFRNVPSNLTTPNLTRPRF